MVIVTSDAADANVKQFRIRPWILQMIILALCVIIGVMIAYFIHEENIWQKVVQRNNEQQEVMKQLEDEKAELVLEIDNLNAKIQVLSDTVNQKVQTENELTALIEKQSTPSEFPLTGSASMQEVTEGDPMLVFTASEGTTVVAAASGNVIAINDDEAYGHNVWIDHGNGYVTIYRNKGNVNVKIGDDVVKGTTLFLIDSDNTVLGYQMMKDGEYINPMEMLEING
ncbi:MAG: peptidoglycan DD-metalloendopeptidase family protein [Lachnospiraceae bacterium]|nr:peptidoglycan DD-metalloendopeptidase family protein [Lachnospiraceae bacterium]